jgi:hypothetical protein
MITGTNSFAPSISVGDGSLTVTTQSGTVFLQGKAVTFPLTNTVVPANATTVIYVDLGARTISTATSFPADCYPICTAVTNLQNQFVSLTDNRPDVPYNGAEFLGFGVTAAGTVTVPIQARDHIWGVVRVRNYAAPEIASIQFNSDTGNNYVSRAVNMPTGGIVWANPIDLTATNMIRLAPVAVTTNRSVEFNFANAANRTKVVLVSTGTTTGSVNTGAPVDFARGEWFNTTAQVTSITLTTPSAINFGADIAIYGKNYS